MPVWIEEVEYVPEDVAASTFTDFLKGNWMQKISLRVQFRVETYFTITSDKPITMRDSSFKTDDWISDPSFNGRFEGFNVDDKIYITALSTYYIISEKINNSSIRVTDTLGGAVTLTAQSVVSGRIELVQDPQWFTFDHGLPANSEGTNFLSKVDGSLQRFERGVTSGVMTNGAMTPVGKKDWQEPSAMTLANTTTGGDRDTHRYHYVVTLDFWIIPPYLPSQITDITNQYPIAPKYFLSREALRHCFHIKAYRELQDVNVFQEAIYDGKKGNTGWADEEYNGGNPVFQASGLGFNNNINAIDPRKVTTIDFDIETINGYSGQALNVTVGFFSMPESPNDYKNRDQYLYQNFTWDYGKATTGGATVNGQRFGTTWQVLKDIVVTSVTATKVHVQCKVDLGTDALAKINTLVDGGYVLYAYAGFGNSQTADYANYTTMLVQVGNMNTEITDSIIDVTTQLLLHDQNTSPYTVPTTPKVKVEDEVVASSVILIDHAAYPNSQIDRFIPQIVAKNTSTGEEAILLSNVIDVIGQKLIGPVRGLNSKSNTGFSVSAGEIREFIHAYRSPSDDITNEYAYRVLYPFLYRWEFWEALNLAALPADFFDSTKNNNGYNNQWVRLAQLTNWNIYFRLQTHVAFNNVTRVINSDVALTELDYDTNAEWDSPVPEFKSFDGTTQITSGSGAYIMQNKKTTMKCEFVYTGGDSIDETDVYAVARLIPKEAGTFTNNESLSSVYDREFKGGIFLGDSNGKIEITENSGKFTCQFDIDSDNLATGVLDYTLSVSINRNTSTGMTDFGIVHKEDMEVLEVIDFTPPEVPKEENPFKRCCYPLRVFADATDTDEFKNDWSAPLAIFPKQYTASMDLEKEVDGVWTKKADLVDDTYGKYYALGFHEKNKKRYIGYKIDWRTVLNASGFGTGKYRIKFETSSGSLYSNEYCLENWHISAANGTVRIKYNWNSVIGDHAQSRLRDFVGLDWWNSLRINDAILWNKNGDFETEEVRYQNGKMRSIKKSFKEKYQLEISKGTIEILDIILYDVLMADEITITDYNSRNVSEYIEQSVEVSGGWRPNYNNNKPEPSVTIDLKDKYDQRNKFYS